MTRHALLFDMDGTVIDSDPIHARVFVSFLDNYGVDIDEADYTRRFHGRRNEEIFAEILPGEDADALDDAKEAAFRSELARIGAAPLPGLLPLMDRARDAGVAIALVTNARSENADAVIEALGLAPRLDAVSLAEDVSRGKPDPAVYTRALSLLGVAAEDALAFEDSPAGLAAARAAGLTTVGLATTLSSDDLRDLGASLAISDFTDPALEPMLSRLLPQGATP